MPSTSDLLADWRAKENAGVGNAWGRYTMEFPALLAAVEAVRELCDKADAEAPASNRMFSGDSFPAYVSTDDIRAAVSAALGTEEE